MFLGANIFEVAKRTLLFIDDANPATSANLFVSRQSYFSVFKIAYFFLFIKVIRAYYKHSEKQRLFLIHLHNESYYKHSGFCSPIF